MTKNPYVTVTFSKRCTFLENYDLRAFASPSYKIIIEREKRHLVVNLTLEGVLTCNLVRDTWRFLDFADMTVVLTSDWLIQTTFRYLSKQDLILL